jgi:hypothetical protein
MSYDRWYYALEADPANFELNRLDYDFTGCDSSIECDDDSDCFYESPCDSADVFSYF